MLYPYCSQKRTSLLTGVNTNATVQLTAELGEDQSEGCTCEQSTRADGDCDTIVSRWTIYVENATVRRLEKGSRCSFTPHPQPSTALQTFNVNGWLCSTPHTRGAQAFVYCVGAVVFWGNSEYIATGYWRSSPPLYRENDPGQPRRVVVVLASEKLHIVSKHGSVCRHIKSTTKPRSDDNII